MRSNTTLALLLALLPAVTLTACGGGVPKEEGFAALGSGDHAKALSRFEAALEPLDSSSPDYVELSVARCRALAYIDSGKSLAEFRALSEEITDPEVLTPGDFREVVTDMLAAEGGAEDAVLLMDVGVKRYPDSEAMKKTLETVVAEVQKRGDAGASDLLKGLGYGGGD